MEKIARALEHPSVIDQDNVREAAALLRAQAARIAALPVRDWRQSAPVDELSAWLRAPGGRQTLRPLQAAGLAELFTVGGCYVQGRVGVGKTLIAGLGPSVVGAKRPLMLIPANGGMVAKTDRELREYRVHWKIPRDLTIRTYQWLGGPQKANALELLKPDFLALDESQWLKNVRADRGKAAAVAVRVARWMAANPSTRVVALSGSPTSKGSILDFAHLLVWCLKNKAPVPIHPDDQELWEAALSGDADPGIVFGAKTTEQAQELFSARLQSAPGVIVSTDRFEGPLTIEPVVLELPQTLEQPYQELRDMHTAPDGYMLGDAFQTYRVARQFARGYYSRHDPRPPEAFLAARRAWAGAVRGLIESGLADSEGHAVNLLEVYPSLRPIYAHWLKWKTAFPLNTVHEWLDDSIARWAADWAKREPGIVWVPGPFFGKRVAALAEVPYFGLGSAGAIMLERGDRSVVASIDAVYQGYNLQGPAPVRPHFSRNLITHMKTDGLVIEQLIGRTHREEQTRPVSVEYLITCHEDMLAIESARNAAHAIEAKTGQPQKLIYGEFSWPRFQASNHSAWRASASKVEDD